MESPHQPTEVREGLIRHRPCGVRWQRHVAVDPRQDLAVLVVDAEMAGRTLEADGFEVEQQVADGRSRRSGRATDGVPDTDRREAGIHPSFEPLLLRHGPMVTQRRPARIEFVWPCRTGGRTVSLASVAGAASTTHAAGSPDRRHGSP